MTAAGSRAEVGLATAMVMMPPWYPPALHQSIPESCFTIEDLDLINNLFLDMDFDDGFIAHINGVEIARSNMLESTPSFNSTAIVDREATIYQSGTPVRDLRLLNFVHCSVETMYWQFRFTISPPAHQISA